MRHTVGVVRLLMLAGLIAMLNACGGSTDSASATSGAALVSVAADSNATTTPPTKIVATFKAQVTSLAAGFFQTGGTCTTPPTAQSTLDATGKIVTVTLSGGVCNAGQTLTLTLDPTGASFATAVGQKGALWTRSYTIPNHAQSVGGSVSGLVGSVALQNNGGDTLTLSGDGVFTFPTLIAAGGAYSVSIKTQPATQTCSVSNGTGTIATIGAAAVQNVSVVCSTNVHTVGGTVSGLAGSLSVQDNGGDTLAISSDGAFTFPTAIAQGGAYAVTVLSMPANQTCTVGNGSGTMGSGAVQNVSIVCSAITRTVGGTVSGLSGTLQLQDNGADTLSLSSDGAFTFATPVAQGGAYAVTVLTQPAAQTCMVTNGSGTVGAAGVANIGVICVANQTTLSVTATGTIPVNGGTVSLTVTNTGSYTATNVSAALPSAWTGVTQDASHCVALAPGATCTLNFTSNTAYVAQGGIAISGDNVGSPPTTALAFTVGGYLVFAVPAANTATVVDTDDIGNLVAWGISSTTVGAGAQSLTDGATNTVNTVYALGSGAVYAAQVCYSSTRGGVPAGTWYLPAVCEAGEGDNAVCPVGTPNIDTNLHQLGFGNFAATNNTVYWSSTEFASSGVAAWSTNYAANPAQALRLDKILLLLVRCARSIAY
ncbi:hypothetical protein [Paraburkholderia sp.]|uniref:hypothetical protein n=1 Tax=Paraburkholderia sp. TaxID=1926495 RepID=UPI00286F5631|nr:hypothetical protein [Paraburkholderia sp.]